MEKLRLLASGISQAAWLVVAAFGRVALGRNRFDCLVDKTGLRGWKNRAWLSSITMPDGNNILFRPVDKCIIEEVYSGVYSAGELGPGQTVVDVGAHIGAFSLMTARLVGPSGRVFAFEPSPATLDLLRRNVERNGLAWIKVHPVALADAEGEAELFTAGDQDNPAADTLAAVAGRRAVKVRLCRLDDILAEEGVSRVDLLKIDVEGAEHRALDGAAKTLARTSRVVLEAHPPRVGPDEIARRLQGAGFSTRIARPPGSSPIIEAVRKT
ncbi:MAG: FkbM family methyltransferase [Elusimicrobia bacterium]|nr:FkbM family methyltransferase [Elusimicrobiota bacterium]